MDKIRLQVTSPMTITKYESFLNLCRMASNQLLTHLSLPSTHRTSIAFFLLITITIFVVPFLSLSTSELFPIALPGIAYTLWNSLLSILTSSPFYFFLLNFLIVALVFLSGVLDPSSPGHEFDGLQEGDLHQRGLHNYSTAAQILHERLALDELYESQASSLPYLNVAENSRIYVADEGMIGNVYGDEGEAHNDKGKQIMASPIASFLHKRPAFSDAEGSDSLEEGSGSSKMDAIGEFFLTGAMFGDESDMKEMSPVSSVVVNSEIDDLHDACKNIHTKDIQAYDPNSHTEKDAEVCLEHDEDGGNGSVDVINNDQRGGNDVIYDEDGDDNMECHGMDGEAEAESESESEADADGKQTPLQPIIAGTFHSQERENVGAEMGLSDEDTSLEEEGEELLGVTSSKSMPLEKQEEKGGEGEELIMSMSTEELNERASAFISAFRKKLISTAIDEVSGQM